MTTKEMIQKVEDIPIAEIIYDREGNELGFTILRWKDVKERVLENMRQWEKDNEKEVKTDE